MTTLEGSQQVAGAGVDLYWLPLGAGGHCVRFNGRIYEAIVALREHRQPRDLYHAALQVQVDGERFVIEVAPVWDRREPDRGVVAVGPVGSALLGRSRWFRYELRRWRSGVIPDVEEAVDSPVRLSSDRAVASRLLELVSGVPILTWGRDESNTGDMWNSNSVVAWLLQGSGLNGDGLKPPAGGSVPGWRAGLAVAARNTGILPLPPAGDLLELPNT